MSTDDALLVMRPELSRASAIDPASEVWQWRRFVAALRNRTVEPSARVLYASRLNEACSTIHR
jgi:hypothetical protein